MSQIKCISKDIKKRVIYTECDCVTLNGDGEFEEFQIVMLGKFTAEQATYALRREYGDINILVKTVNYKQERYKMSLAEFIEHAELIG